MSIKSEKAKELIEYGKFSYDEIQAYVLPESYVETIVVQAEEDAKDRAINAFEDFIEHLGETSLTTKEIAYNGDFYIKKFKQLYDESNKQTNK